MSINNEDIGWMSSQELIELLDRERRRIDQLRKENKELECNNELIKPNVSRISSEVQIEEKVDITQTDSFEKEYKSYLEEFNKLKEYTKESIESILPARSNYNYERIIMRLIADVSRKIIDDNEFFAAFGYDMSKEELQEYRNNVVSNKAVRLVLKEFLFEEEKEEHVESQNKLIFVPIKSTGKIRIFDELKDVPEEEYDGFIELLESIKNGTFKGFKTFTNNDLLNGLLEVRGHQVRVAYQRLSEDCYAIVSLFRKKTQNDMGYRKPLQAKYTEYKSIESDIKNKIKDEKYLAKNQEYEYELFKKLRNKKGDTK